MGTSTGGILAAGLTVGVSINKIMKLYNKKGKAIFKNPFPPDKPMKQLQWVFQNTGKSANSSQVLIQELKNMFGNKTIAQTYKERKIALCITAVNVKDHSPHIFKTPHGSLKNGDANRKLVDICLATSSAPVFFPIAHISDPNRNNVYEEFIDGGLWANSPILLALTEAVGCAEEKQRIEIISIGTCPPPTGQMVLDTNSKGGLSQWRYGIDLMELTMDSQTQGNHLIADFLCTHLRTLGKEVVIYRLKQTKPLLQEAKFLSIDQANEKTCSLLVKYGRQDGEAAYKETMSKDNQILKDIFSRLPDSRI